MRKSWSKEEIEIVTREYKENPKCVLLRLIKTLGRSKGSIHRKANRLGLTNWKNCGGLKGTPHPWCRKRLLGRLGKDAIGWKGGRSEHEGYILIHKPDHPLAGSDDCVLEHRLVMEKHLGRYLKREEQVHHRNGIKNDNRLSNLEITKIAHRGKVVCPFCNEKFSIK